MNEISRLSGEIHAALIPEKCKYPQKEHQAFELLRSDFRLGNLWELNLGESLDVPCCSALFLLNLNLRP